MIQRHRTHPSGTFAACSGCGREPMHLVMSGSTSVEPTHTPTEIRKGATADRHQLECPRCNRATARLPSLDACIAEWGSNYSQGELALALPTRRHRAA